MSNVPFLCTAPEDMMVAIRDKLFLIEALIDAMEPLADLKFQGEDWPERATALLYAARDQLSELVDETAAAIDFLAAEHEREKEAA